MVSEGMGSALLLGAADGVVLEAAAASCCEAGSGEPTMAPIIPMPSSTTTAAASAVRTLWR